MATLWSRLLGRERKMDTLELFKQVFGTSSTWANKDVTLETALQVSTALACGRVIAEGIAMLPWKVLQRVGDSIHPVPEHPLYDRLATMPSSVQTTFEFQETLGLHLAYTGNAFIWTPRVGKKIDQLLLFEPKWVTVEYRWPDPPTYKIRMEGRPELRLTSAEVWHVRGPSWSSYVGMEFLKLARQALGLSMAIEEGQAKLQGQGVKLPGFLSVDGVLTKEQGDKLREWLEKDYAGSANTGRPMVLDRATKWMTTAMSNVEAQTLEQRKLQIEEVCRFMRVLPIMVRHADKTATYASAEQMMMAHAIYTLGPWARRLEQSADRWLLSEEERKAGYYTKLNEKALQRMTARDQMEYLARGTAAGIMTRNEAREKLDLNPLEGLDEPLTQAGSTTTPEKEPEGGDEGTDSSAKRTEEDSDDET